MNTPAPGRPTAAQVEAAILRLVTAAGPTASISPEDVAKALAPETWRSLLAAVRQHAVRLMQQGRIDILRKGKAVTAAEVRGVIRLRLRA